METHMQKKTVKFNRRKHKRDPGIIFGILRSVNKKNQLYRTLKVLEKCTKNLIGHSRLAFNNHESNIDC